MKRSSSSVAKLLLTLSLVIAATSLFQAHKWSEAGRGLRGQLAAAAQAQQQAARLTAELTPLLPGSETPLALDKTVSELILVLNQAQLEHRVLLGGLAPAAVGAGGSFDLQALSQPVANTALRVLTLQIKGTYREYAGLKAYLERVRQQPVALTRLIIAGNSFELEVQVFGVLT